MRLIGTVGNVSNVDENGRVYLPPTHRDRLGIKIGDPVNMYVDEERGILCIKRCCHETITEFEMLIDSLKDEGDNTLMVAVLESMLKVYKKSRS